MSRLKLRFQALIFRTLQSIYTFFDLYLSHPLPRRVSCKRRISSTVSSIPGSFDLLFYTPPSYKKRPSSTTKHPLLVNFHGGGFTIGHAGDDARWATEVTTQTSALVVSVNYRLAPTHPFPTGIEDCVSAILWLWKHADEYNLDISQTALSGFSAGGNLAYAVSIRLHQELERLRKEGQMHGLEAGKIVELVVFYGSTENQLSREERDKSNPDLIPIIPKALFRLFEESYLFPMPDMRSPLLSPGIAPDQLLRDALPQRVVIISCAGDQLLVESERFRKRLVGLGKSVEGCVVQGVGHGWDKKPSFRRGNVKRDEAYGLAVRSLKEAWV
jgi:ergosteryl-3beta-O-L-aspartate hydrolase